MELALPLAQMSKDEKLRAIECIWEDLLRSGAPLDVPAWHLDVLRAREARIASGASHFSDWDEAKQRIRDRTR